MRLGELCAGYGGLGMAVEEVFGATTAWFSEFDAAPSKILAHHWPDVPNHGDMTKIDWAEIEHADIISGGTPCQDLSAAGKRQGMSEGTRSNLWVNMREAIAIQKPTYVVWENVRGALSATATSEMEQCPGCLGNPTDCALRALGRVLGDLADIGFHAEWRGVHAGRHAGGAHGRYRIFLLAYSSSQRSRQGHIPTGSAAPSRDGAGVSHQPATGHLRGINWGQHRTYIERWERIHGRAPSPFEYINGKPRPSAKFGEWVMGIPAGWVTDVPDISHQAMWKAIGNGVMPPQAKPALIDMLRSIREKEMRTLSGRLPKEPKGVLQAV